MIAAAAGTGTDQSRGLARPAIAPIVWSESWRLSVIHSWRRSVAALALPDRALRGGTDGTAHDLGRSERQGGCGPVGRTGVGPRGGIFSRPNVSLVAAHSLPADDSGRCRSPHAI